MSDVINTYIDGLDQAWQADIGRQLHALVQGVLPDAEARIQYGKPHYLKNGKYAAVFGTAKGWVSFTIFYATELEPPADPFEVSANGERITIKIKADQDVDYGLLGDLLKQASDTI